MHPVQHLAPTKYHPEKAGNPTWRYLDSIILGRIRVRMGRKEASRRGKIILMYGHGQNPSTQSSISWAT